MEFLIGRTWGTWRDRAGPHLLSYRTGLCELEEGRWVSDGEVEDIKFFVRAHMGVHGCGVAWFIFGYRWRPESTPGIILQTPILFLFVCFSDRVSLNLELPQVVLAGWPASPRGLPDSISPVLKLHDALPHLFFFLCGLWGSNLSLHACSARPLPAEPHPIGLMHSNMEARWQPTLGMFLGRKKTSLGSYPCPHQRFVLILCKGLSGRYTGL